MGICLAQVNPTVGDPKGNVETLRLVVQANSTEDLIVFPELFLTGYPPRDLLFQKGFLASVEQSLGEIQRFSTLYPQTAVVVGTPWLEAGRLFNAAVVIQAGSMIGIQRKRRLTKFRGFDETLYFSAGDSSVTLQLGPKTLAVALGLELDRDLAIELRKAGADLIINPAAIPFRAGEGAKYNAELSAIAKEAGTPIVRVSQVGGNDGLIFSGGSVFVDQTGDLRALVPKFQVGSALVDLAKPAEVIAPGSEDDVAEVFQGLVLGLRDYVRKSGMTKVIVGLSGGLDSAVSGVIATEALGADNVWGITQPGPYSPKSSAEDATQLAKNLKIRFDTLPIAELYEAMLISLNRQFLGTKINVAEENIQARLRGSQLMALSNKFGGLVLSNSNKSELSVGYCTLYGDMCGGLAPLADLYKTMVYQLAYYINRKGEIIPWSTIEKPPSAELRPDQRDDETLPPYDILDGIIKAHLDDGLGTAEIISQGYDEETVLWVIDTIGKNDYKRLQAALILQVTSPIYGTERNMPIAVRKRF